MGQAPSRPAERGSKLTQSDLEEPTVLRKDLEMVARLPFDGGVFRGEDNRHLASGEGALNISVFVPDRPLLEN